MGSTPAVEIDRAKQVFRFLKAFAERSIPTRRTLRDQPWQLLLRDLPDHPSISVGLVVLESGLAAEPDGCCRCRPEKWWRRELGRRGRQTKWPSCIFPTV